MKPNQTKPNQTFKQLVTFGIAISLLFLFQKSYSQTCPQFYSLTSCCAKIVQNEQREMTIYESACNVDKELNAKVKVETSSQDGMYLWVSKTNGGSSIFPGAGWVYLPSTTTTQSYTVYLSDYGYGTFSFWITSQPFSNIVSMRNSTDPLLCRKSWEDSKIIYQFGLCKNLTEGTNCGCDNNHCAIITR